MLNIHKKNFKVCSEMAERHPECRTNQTLDRVKTLDMSCINYLVTYADIYSNLEMT